MREEANVLLTQSRPFGGGGKTLVQASAVRRPRWEESRDENTNTKVIKICRHKQLYENRTGTAQTCGKEWVNRVYPSRRSPPHITSVIQGPTRLVRWTLINLQRASPTIADPPPVLSLVLALSLSRSLSPAWPSPSQTFYHFTHDHLHVWCTFEHKK